MLVLSGCTYQKNEEIVIYSMEDGTILLNTVTEEVTVINELGAFIWNCIEQEKEDISLCDLMSSIKGVYHVDEKVDIEKEIADFLLDLIHCKALIKNDI